MSINNQLKEFAFKRFGFLNLTSNEFTLQIQEDLTGFIQVIFLKTGSKAMIDFKEYHLQQDALFL